MGYWNLPAELVLVARFLVSTTNYMILMSRPLRLCRGFRNWTISRQMPAIIEVLAGIALTYPGGLERISQVSIVTLASPSG